MAKNGRGERIRTSDPLVPNQVRYQTALRPEQWIGEWLAVRGRTQNSGKQHELQHPLTNLLILAEVDNGHDGRVGVLQDLVIHDAVMH